MADAFGGRAPAARRRDVDRYGNGLAALLMGFSDPEAEIEKARRTTDADAQDPPFCAIMTLIVPLRGTSRSRYTQI